MYKLFYTPGAASLAPHAVLQETGAPHELVRIDLQAGDHKRPDYLKLNPHGRIPTLIVDGAPVFESAAICMLLAERHPEVRLAPAPGTRARALYLQWLVYLTNTLQERFLQRGHPDWHLDDKAAEAALKAGAEKRIGPMFDRIDAALAADGPYLAGAAFSVADIYLAMLVRWSRNLPDPAWSRPAIKRNCDLVIARPAFQRTLAAEGIAWPY
ncbi:MAG: glutathione S-transferase N-terminal domain-containing protein [Alphaproteobacteria bacterium]|nr:glutathione S-transferase N-terminal domain-containing protein [Alphaproteobacteria bacterium]